MITARDLRKAGQIPRGGRPLHHELRVALRQRPSATSRWTGIPDPVLDRMAAGEPVKMSSLMLMRLACLAMNLNYEGDFLESSE